LLHKKIKEAMAQIEEERQPEEFSELQSEDLSDNEFFQTY
jgi:hypothetical protein